MCPFFVRFWKTKVLCDVMFYSCLANNADPGPHIFRGLEAGHIYHGRDHGGEVGVEGSGK